MTLTNTAQRMVDLLGSYDRHYAEANIYVQALGNEAIGYLLPALQGSDIDKCVDAIQLMQYIHEDTAANILLNLQHHPHPWVRMASARAMGSFHPYIRISDLQAWCQGERDVMVQVWLIMSIGQIGGSEAVPALLTLLKQSRSATLTFTTIRMLGRLGDQGAAKTIETYLTDADPHIRKDAEQALAKLYAAEKDEADAQDR